LADWRLLMQARGDGCKPAGLLGEVDVIVKRRDAGGSSRAVWVRAWWLSRDGL